MDPQNDFTADQQKALHSVRPSRIIVPMLIGLGVVGFLFYREFDITEWRAIDWTLATLFWVGVSLTLLVIRHLFYATRLYILSEHDFSFRKCIELVFIWEFSSAVSPTSVGGSAVALFVLSQERLSAGRTASLVIYTIVLDTAFFVGGLGLLYLLFGPGMIRPGAVTLADLGAWGKTFWLAWGAMALYGTFFFWGLFVSPTAIRRVLRWLAGVNVLKRFRKTLLRTAQDTVAASVHMRRQPLRWHLGAFGSTAGAWSCRFLLLSCLIVAFGDVSLDPITQLGLYGRLKSMYLIIAFSPTPGGAGFAESMLPGFTKDYMGANTTSVLLVAMIWRGFTYYAYLLAGAIVIPNWITSIRVRRAQRKVGVHGASPSAIEAAHTETV